MSKYFRPWNIDQTLLLPPNVQDFVPKGHVSRFIVELVRESLDLKEITGSYVSGLGQPPFDPRMMVALLLHGYASGLYLSEVSNDSNVHPTVRTKAAADLGTMAGLKIAGRFSMGIQLHLAYEDALQEYSRRFPLRDD